MKIRSVTQFIPLSWPFKSGDIGPAARLLADARFRFSDAGFDVQSVCLAIPPFLDVLGFPDEALLLELSDRLEELAQKHRIDAVSIGPVIATTPHAPLMCINMLPPVINNTKKIFTGVLFADGYSGINIAAARAFAQAVCTVSQETANGAGNLRMTAATNVPANVPFSPVAYHQGYAPSFAVFTEAADLALTALSGTRSINTARKRLTESIESSSAHILKIASELEAAHQIEFSGIDFSPAPFAMQARSMGQAIEKFGVDLFGSTGTVFATAYFNQAIQQANIPRTGFSGVMLPVLGDAIIAQRAKEGRFSANDLLLYAAAGASGLDLVPLPGNTTPEQLAGLYLDMAALSVTANRPLFARLLPIPDAAVGQVVTLGNTTLSSGAVIPIKPSGAGTLLKKSSFLSPANR